MIRTCLSSLLSSRTAGPLVLALFVGLSLTACDQSSQNIDFTSGSNLTLNTIKSPGFIPNFDSATTAEYQIRAFSIDKEYEWSVSGVASRVETRRQGENLVVSASTPGSYTVTATTTIDGEEVSGSASASVDYPPVTTQADRYNKLSVFGDQLANTGLAGVFTNTEDDLTWTALAPSNQAFVNALDASGNGALESSEVPALGVLASVLQYHAAAGILRASDISDGQTVPSLLHPQETLTFNKSNGTVTVDATNGTSTVETPDIATNDGVVHQIDGVLLPASVVSINDQTATQDNGDDVVAVEGTFVIDGGFVALHDSTRGGDIIGVSEKLSPGFHGNTGPIEITLDSQLSDTTGIVAMPHRDTNGDGQFTFNPSTGTDVPYFRGSSSVPVVDSSSVAPPPAN